MESSIKFTEMGERNSVLVQRKQKIAAEFMLRVRWWWNTHTHTHHFRGDMAFAICTSATEGD